MEAETTTGGAVLGLLTGIAKAVTTGLKAAKEVDEGCNSCPDDDEKGEESSPKIRYTRRRRRRK